MPPARTFHQSRIVLSNKSYNPQEERACLGVPGPHASLGGRRPDREGRNGAGGWRTWVSPLISPVLYESALTILRKPLDTSRRGFSIPRDAPTSERTRLLIYSRHGQVHPGRRGPARKAAGAEWGTGDIRDAAFPSGFTLVQLASGRARGEGNSVQRTGVPSATSYLGGVHAAVDADVITRPTNADGRDPAARNRQRRATGGTAGDNRLGKRSATGAGGRPRWRGKRDRGGGKWNEKERRTAVGTDSVNLTWIHELGERIVGGRWPVRGTEKGEKERDGEEITFDFELLGIGYTFSPSCLPRRGRRRRFLPPLSRPSPSLRDCSAGQGRGPRWPRPCRASSRSIGFAGDFRTVRVESVDFAGREWNGWATVNGVRFFTVDDVQEAWRVWSNRLGHWESRWFSSSKSNKVSTHLL